jgi:hypothetical protein
VRTTLTLDEDVAAKLRAEVRRSGCSFKEAVNEALRRGLLTGTARAKEPPFEVKARDLGRLRPGLSLDSVASLLEQIEGPLHR